MENQVRSPAVKGASFLGLKAQGGITSWPWIVSPTFDLLFLANVGWILVPVLALALGQGPTAVEFWQLYFLTTPHRWITLFLVAADPDRRGQRTGLFLGIALLAFGLVWGIRVFTGAFLCLLLVDCLWNGWHFASQHAGILRMYSRKVNQGFPWLEKQGLRFFAFYVILRTAGWATGWLEISPLGLKVLLTVDCLALLLPVGLTCTVLAKWKPEYWPKMLYLGSVCLLYSALLLGLMARFGPLILGLTISSAAFHAIEYLAVVTQYAWKRQETGSISLFRAMARRWALFLLSYLLILGLIDALIRLPSQTLSPSASWSLAEIWAGLNLWAAFLHYTYDGMIWKLRKPETARSLGLVSPTNSLTNHQGISGMTTPFTPNLATKKAAAHSVSLAPPGGRGN